MPPLSPHHLALVGLAERMAEFGALPGPGGLLDQDAELMEALTAIVGSSWWRATHGG